MSKKQNNNLLYSIIAILLIAIVGILIYFLGGNNNPNNTLDNKSDITLKIIEDKRCGEKCGDINEIIKALKSQVPKLENSKIEISDFSEEKDYIKENDIKFLPAIIFSQNNIDSKIDPFLIKLKNNQYSLNIGASFDPYAEICDNKIDDNNDGKIDCEDPTCSSQTMCRTEEKGKLQVFLMGYCPFGEIAAKAIPQIQDVLKDGLNLDIHFIATKTGNTDKAESFNSLHGVPEAEEDIRSLCIKKEYGVKKLVDYYQTRYANADNYGKVTDNPSDAFKANNIDAKKINTCIENGEGAKLLEEDIKLAQELGISASPTWFANNKYQFGGINAKQIISNFCKYNSDLEGCKGDLKNIKTTNTGSNPSCN